jgi:L-serine/L-threonine ammonia-lyase
LAAKKVCQNAFELSQQFDVHSRIVSDQEAVNACLKFVDDHRLLVEPACGATLSVLYDQKIQFKLSDQVLVIVCGGAGITLETLQGFNG